MSEIEDRVLRLERVLPVSIERAYRAWVDPEERVKWWGPEGVTVVKHETDVRVGGHYSCTMRSTDGDEHIICGEFKALEPSTMLAFTWAWINDGVRGHETVVRVEFEERDGTTLMRLEQRVFQDQDARDKHNYGWCSSFKKLDAHCDASPQS